MTIDALKEAIVEVHNLCATRDTCDGCPFGEEDAHQHLCYLSPIPYSKVIPSIWNVESLKEKENFKCQS